MRGRRRIGKSTLLRAYVENFSGGAFENLVEYILMTSEKRHEGIFEKLNLVNINFEMETHWDKEKKINLIATSTEDKHLFCPKRHTR